MRCFDGYRTIFIRAKYFNAISTASIIKLTKFWDEWAHAVDVKKQSVHNDDKRCLCVAHTITTVNAICCRLTRIYVCCCCGVYNILYYFLFVEKKSDLLACWFACGRGVYVCAVQYYKFIYTWWVKSFYCTRLHSWKKIEIKIRKSWRVKRNT